MARRSSSFGFLGRFGRSADLRMLDEALRLFDLHPARVPDGAKLALVNLMKDADADGEPPEEAYPFVAHLVAYCALGRDVFALANGEQPASDAEARIAAALENPDGFDARLVLLTIHAKLIHPAVVERFGLSAVES
jgi:hypothetical protein